MITTLSPELLLCLALLTSLSLYTTKRYRVYALRKGVIDTPNARSSHQVSTPRGGGISIIIGFTIITLSLLYTGTLPLNQVCALLVGSLPIAAIGLIDDHNSVSARVRFSVHFFSALCALLLLDKMPTLIVGDIKIYLDFLWLAPLAIALTWLTNLYNFMDGIDGIASTEAICVLFGALLITSSNEHINFVLLLYIAPIVGFLVLNWAPAKIFMGDSGSGFLGGFFGIFAIVLASLEQVSLWAWLILLGTFVTDASWTLMARISDGQTWHEAHRTHSYQILSRKWQSHQQVNAANAVINLLWLTPLAFAAHHWPHMGWLIAAAAYAPLILISYKLKAGSRIHT